MAKKTARIPSKPRQDNADEWVSGQTPSTKGVVQSTKTGTTKRLTLDLDESLHRRIKLACTIRGSTMVRGLKSAL